MKKVVVILQLLAALSVTAAPPAGNFTLTFEDGFSGTKLNSSKWKMGTHYEGIEGQGGNNPDNISVANGYLKIRASTDNVVYGGKSYNYSGGEISTITNFRQKHGYFEARMRCPAVQGLWPAFWLMPDRGIPVADEPNFQRSYLKFNLSSSGIGYVNTATLRLKVAAMTPFYNSTDRNNVMVCGVQDDNWTEGNIRWSNAPDWDPVYLDTDFNKQGDLAVGDYVDLDVRDFVAIENSGDKIISLMLGDGLLSGKLVAFHSSEASNSANRPQLIVNGTSYAPSDDAYVRRGSSYINTNYGNNNRLNVMDDAQGGISSTFNGGMEVDIMESLGIWGAYETSHALHWDGYLAQQQSAGFGDIPINNSANFHTYGLYWEEDFFVFYVDGVQTGAFWNDRVMNTTAHVILSLQIGGWDGNTPTSGIQNKVLEVDYVKVWSGTKSGGINAHEGNRKAIKNKYTEKALQTPAGSAGALNNAEMVQATFNAAYDSQRWNVIDAGSGYYQIESVRSGKALMPENSSTATDALIEQFTWSNYNAQKWTFFKTDTTGFYRIKNKHSGKVMRPLGGNTAENAKISQVPVNAGAHSQRWEVTN